MTERPDIDMCPDSETFRAWYFLKSDLVAFARANGMKTTGGKFDQAQLRQLWALRRKQPGPYVFDISDLRLLDQK